MSLLLPNSMKIIDKMDFCPLTHHGPSGICQLFLLFLKKLLSSIERSRRTFSRQQHTHTHIYISAHIALFYFWKTELFFFLPKSDSFFSLSFLHNVFRGTIFVNWSSPKKPFQTTQLQIVSEWVSCEWVEGLDRCKIKKKNKKKHHINQLSIPLASQLGTTATGRFRTSCRWSMRSIVRISIVFISFYWLLASFLLLCYASPIT